MALARSLQEGLDLPSPREFPLQPLVHWEQEELAMRGRITAEVGPRLAFSTKNEQGTSSRNRLKSLSSRLKAPARSSLLEPGSSFSGWQTLLHGGRVEREERWRVTVIVTEAELSRGLIRGCMTAVNAPAGTTGVRTFWEGEVVDGKHASFVTGRHGASAPIDVQHWSQFPSFRRLALSDEGLRQEGVVVHDVERFIYMRWKETFFLSSPAECTLTIAGFYYICLDTLTGAVEGYYYDPHSSPFQRLTLTRDTPPAGVMTLGTCELI